MKYKLGNYCTKLRRPEVSVNALTNKPDDRYSPVCSEVNYCPVYPTGETKETLEMMRVALLSVVKKRNNEEKVAMLMDKTFAYKK